MNHQLDKTSAECVRCINIRYTSRTEQPWWEDEHLQAQQALLWAAACDAFGPDTIANILRDGSEDENAASWFDLQEAIRSRMEKQDA